MAVSLDTAPESYTGDVLPHKTWTRDELLLVEETGVFDGTHFELIDGELIDKMGKKHPHVMSTRKTVLALDAVFNKANIIQEGPIDVAPEDNQRNEPEPDVMVLRMPYGEIARNPRPFEIALVVEIADSSLSQDLTTKARLYARASIQEYWVVDLKNRRLHVFRDPSKDGYERRFEAGETDSVAPLERPEHMIAVATLLG